MTSDGFWASVSQICLTVQNVLQLAEEDDEAGIEKRTRMKTEKISYL